ncbi:MAG: superoxide dismutase [Rikenellaceae bacterium]
MGTIATHTDYFVTKKLPIAYGCLAPAISEQTLRLHHDKHYAGYVNTLNKLVENTRFAPMSLEEVVLTAGAGAIFNNAAQAWNHLFYFDQFSPSPKREPTGGLLDAVEDSFGTFDDMLAQIYRGSTSLFGSGWLWLVVNEDERLELIASSNAGNPIINDKRPILTIDLWEHAYYVDYENRREEAVKAHVTRVDWRVIEGRYGVK